jgi:prepilin-type N-terminal cleavage/methylation domain-containing protein
MNMQICKTRHEFSKTGFTLVELSIVLVIIGLISASVLIGRELIFAAQIRAQVRQIEELNTIVNTFKLKYKCLPGDCGHAIALGWGTFDGNDDGIIIGHSTPMHGLEPAHFWWELVNAGMLPGDPSNAGYGGWPGINSPLTKLRGSSVPTPPVIYTNAGFWTAPYTIMNGVDIDFPNSWVMLSIEFNQSGGDLPQGIFLPFETYVIDQKIDNGYPMSGSMRSVTGIDAGQAFYLETTTSSGQTDACINDSPPNGAQPLYNMTVTVRTATSLCLPVIKTQW